MTYRIGILHPGEMGISIAASALKTSMTVYWCAEDRSKATRTRANKLGLKSLPTLQETCDTCDVLIAVCPPHAAVDLASEVVDCKYRGIYADVNAIAPDTVKIIGQNMTEAGIAFIDGGIIGLPATKPGTTWLYLSGQDADKVAECFIDGALETSVLGNEIGQASGLKMCFAANSKGVAAMQTAILATAELMGVRAALEQQWDIFNPGFTEKSKARIKQVARKAWRFSGEMKEIATTLAAADMPAEFHLGAAEIYRRQSSFKDEENEPTIEKILEVVLRKPED